jgi:hypothetical protein
MQLPSVPRKLCGHHDKLVMAAQASPLWCHGFCKPRQLCNEKKNIKHQHDGKNAPALTSFGTGQACHREAAAAAHTAERYLQFKVTLNQ